MPRPFVIKPLQSIDAHPGLAGWDHAHQRLVYLSGLGIFERFSEALELRGGGHAISDDSQDRKDNQKHM